MNYVDFNVGQVISIKNKYGFRIKLKLSDGKEIVRQKSGFANRREAIKQRDKTLADLFSGRYIVNDSYTVESFFEMWLKDVMMPRIKATTYSTYFYSLKNYIYPGIGNIKLSELNRGNITAFYGKVAEQSIYSARMCRVILKTGLKYAEQKNYISINPAEGIQIPKVKMGGMYHTLNINRQKTLTKEQMQVLIDKSHNSKIYLYILFASLLGLRKGEIRGLKFSDVDYINSTINIQRQLGEKTVKYENEVKLIYGQEITPKTKSGNRMLYLPKILLEAIIEQRAKYEDNRYKFGERFNDLNYICCNGFGNPNCEAYVHSHFKKLLQENGLPDIRFHDLRHTYATMLLKEEISSKAVSVSLGHSKTIVTIDVYTDKKRIIEDYEMNIDHFIKEIIPKEHVHKTNFVSAKNYISEIIVNDLIPNT